MIRLAIFVVLLGFGITMLLPEKGISSQECTTKQCERGWENACVTLEEAKEIEEGCKTRSCGLCAISRPYDACYRNHGTCVKEAGSCGWQVSKDLQKCIRLVDAAENIKNHNSVTFPEYVPN